MIQWILKILHDLEYVIPQELWYFSTSRSCRIFSINSGTSRGSDNLMVGRRSL